MRNSFFAILALVLLSLAESAPAAAEPAAVTIRADRKITTVNPLLYGQFIEHLGKCIKDGLWTPDDKKNELVLGGVRKELFDAMREMNIPLLRWPGGCFSDGYHWKDGIGPRARRPARKNLAWARGDENSPTAPVDDNAFGTDEFLRLCEALGIEPLINVNLGSGTPEEARQWVEYANGAGDTEYGALRAANGHPEPYGVKYWGVGNEIWGDYEIGHTLSGVVYGERFLEFAREMRRAGPGIKLLAVGSSPAMTEWNRQVLQTAGREIDHLSLHVYYPGFSLVKTWEKNRKWEYYGIMAAARDLGETIDSVDARIGEYAPDARLALDEWNLWWNEQQIVRAEDYTFPAALFTADVLMQLLRRGDRVAYANFAQLVNVLAVIVSDPEKGVYMAPAYYPFKLFSNEIKDGDVLETNVRCDTFSNHEYGLVKPSRGNPYLQALATRDAAGVLKLVVINKHIAEDITAEITVEGAAPPAACSAKLISAPSPFALNTFDAPDALPGITDHPCPAPEAGRLVYSFPKHSISLLAFR